MLVSLIFILKNMKNLREIIVIGKIVRKILQKFYKCSKILETQ